jgi:hypothetical protein
VNFLGFSTAILLAMIATRTEVAVKQPLPTEQSPTGCNLGLPRYKIHREMGEIWWLFWWLFVSNFYAFSCDTLQT